MTNYTEFPAPEPEDLTKLPEAVLVARILSTTVTLTQLKQDVFMTMLAFNTLADIGKLLAEEALRRNAAEEAAANKD